VRVDVVDGGVEPLHGLLHAGNGTVARRGHHVFAIAGGTKAHHFGEDVGATGQGVVQAFQHHGTAAAGDHETIAVRVVGA